MGCFSFLCSECGDPINSDSFSGEHCVLFIMENGQIREYMQGQYDSYGRVLDDSLQSVEWEMDWSAVCDLMFSSDPHSGIAAYHSSCWKGGTPLVSDDDPEQGWGEYKHPTIGPSHRHVKGYVRLERTPCDPPEAYGAKSR